MFSTLIVNLNINIELKNIRVNGGYSTAWMFSAGNLVIKISKKAKVEKFHAVIYIIGSTEIALISNKSESIRNIWSVI